MKHRSWKDGADAPKGFPARNVSFNACPAWLSPTLVRCGNATLVVEVGLYLDKSQEVRSFWDPPILFILPLKHKLRNRITATYSKACHQGSQGGGIEAFSARSGLNAENANGV